MFITTVQNVAHLGVVHIEIWEAAMFIVTEVKTLVTTLGRKVCIVRLKQLVLSQEAQLTDGVAVEQLEQQLRV